MLDEAKLRQALLGLNLKSAVVQVVGGPMFVATVTSGSFTSQSEAKRQAQVWEHLRKQLSSEDLTQVEFVFTNAPGDDSSEAED